MPNCLTLLVLVNSLLLAFSKLALHGSNSTASCVLNRPSWPADYSYFAENADGVMELTASLATFPLDEDLDVAQLKKFCAGEPDAFPTTTGKLLEYTVVEQLCPEESATTTVNRNLSMRKISKAAKAAAVIDVFPGVVGDKCEQCELPGRFSALYQTSVDDTAPPDLKCSILGASVSGLEEESRNVGLVYNFSITIDANTWLEDVYPSFGYISLFSVCLPVMAGYTGLLAFQSLLNERKKEGAKQSPVVVLMLMMEMAAQGMLVIYYLATGHFARGTLLHLQGFYLGIGGLSFATTLLTASFWFDIKKQYSSAMRKSQNKEKKRMSKRLLAGVTLFSLFDVFTWVATHLIGPGATAINGATFIIGQAIASCLFIKETFGALRTTIKAIEGGMNTSEDPKLVEAKRRLMKTGKWLMFSAVFMVANIIVSVYFAAMGRIWFSVAYWNMGWFGTHGTRIAISFCQVRAVKPLRTAGERTMGQKVYDKVASTFKRTTSQSKDSGESRRGSSSGSSVVGGSSVVPSDIESEVESGVE